MFKGYFIKKIISWLAKLDGMDGLSLNDLVALVKKADQITEITGSEKAQNVINNLIEWWGGNQGWILQTITQLAYAYARIKGYIKR